MKWVLVALVVFGACALMRAQGAAAPHDSATSKDAKTSPSADGKPTPTSKPDLAGKVELRDIKPQSSPVASPLTLKDTYPVSTEDVVRGVARELAKQDAGEPGGQTSGPSSANTQGRKQSTSKASAQAQSPDREPAEANDAVKEFQPAPAGSGTASSARAVLDGAQSKSSRVHGDLYGVAGADGHVAGGSVGATSKSGKTSVYVQSDEARSKAGQPQ